MVRIGGQEIQLAFMSGIHTFGFPALYAADISALAGSTQKLELGSV